MLSLNIPQVRFIATVYAVTKRSNTQAFAAISLKSLQPAPKLGGPCLLSPTWSRNSSLCSQCSFLNNMFPVKQVPDPDTPVAICPLLRASRLEVYVLRPMWHEEGLRFLRNERGRAYKIVGSEAC